MILKKKTILIKKIFHRTLMKKYRSVEQLKQQYCHYQEIYQQATPEGKSYIRLQLDKLERQIKGIEPQQYRIYRPQ